MKIFQSINDDFSTNGLGQIIPIKCIETKKKSLNGWFLNCEVDKKYKDIIKKDNIVVVETKEKGPQPFVINNLTISKRITFTAEHFIFTSQKYILDDVRPTNLLCNDFLEYINERLDTASPFNIYSNINTYKTSYFIRKTMLEALEETEVLFDGVFDIDGNKISLLSTIENLSDQTLIYQKNISDIKMYENWDSVCTKIFPVGPEGLTLPEKYIESDVFYEIPYTQVVSFSIKRDKDNDEQKTDEEMMEELRQLAIMFLDENKYPKINITISADVPQNLKIGDIVPVKHPLALINTAVQSYTYDVNLKRVKTIEYGNYERNVKKEFQNIRSEISEIDKRTDDFLMNAKTDVYYLMNVAGKNGSVVFRKNESGVIYEILAMDTNDIETSESIMRFNAQGLAGTNDGIDGEFKAAILSNGTIVADMIKVGTLQGIRIICESGLIGGYDIDATGMTAVYTRTLPTNYSQVDLQRCQNIILGNIQPTAEDYERLDVNVDGAITSKDYIEIQKIISGVDSNVWNYRFHISSQNPTKYITYSISKNGTANSVFEDTVSLESIGITAMQEINKRLSALEREVGI